MRFSGMRSTVCSTRVDFPMPGSPPIKTRDPCTRPPPSTRFSSASWRSMRGSSSATISWRVMGLAFGGLYARYGTLVHHFFPYHLFHIRVPHSARRTLAYPFGRVLSAVAAYINRLLFSHSCAFSSKMIAQRYNFSMQGLQTPP